jgi:hypothetical protein
LAVAGRTQANNNSIIFSYFLSSFPQLFTFLLERAQRNKNNMIHEKIMGGSRLDPFRWRSRLGVLGMELCLCYYCK